MNEKAKGNEYCIFGDRCAGGVIFFMKTGRFSDWVGGQVMLRYTGLIDAKKFMAFAKLFGCTYAKLFDLT